MAYVTKEQFDALLKFEPCVTTVGLPKESWKSFDLEKQWRELLDYLGPLWWGYVAGDDVSDELFGCPSVKTGTPTPAVISGCFIEFDEPIRVDGTVCVLTVDLGRGTTRYHVRMKEGRFWCEGVTDTSSHSLVDQVKAVCGKLNVTLLRKPREIREQPVTFKMEKVIQFFRDAQAFFLGSVTESDILSIAHKLEKLRAAKGGERQYAALVSRRDDRLPFGYLMEIITDKLDERHQITFGSLGLKIIQGSEESGYFRTFAGLLEYVTKELGLQLIQ